MMELAENEYPVDRFLGRVQADITRTGFPPETFDCILVLGFLHRVPLEIKRKTLFEIALLTRRLAIVTCSVDNPFQRLKHAMLSKFLKRHVPAPYPVSLKEVAKECESAGFKVVQSFMVAPFLSAEAMLILEKKVR